MSLLLIGVGNPLRGDDALGLRALELVRAAAPGLATLSLERVGPELYLSWQDAERVVIVDACRGAGAPGEILRLEASAGPLPAELAALSTHGGGLGPAIELARVLGELPPALVVLALEGEDFTPGAELSAPVAAALPDLARRALAELEGLE